MQDVAFVEIDERDEDPDKREEDLVQREVRHPALSDVLLEIAAIHV
jgi:hypothetical protein